MEYGHSLARTLIAECHGNVRRWRCGGIAGEKGSWCPPPPRKKGKKGYIADLFCFEENTAKMRKEEVNGSNHIVQYRNLFTIIIIIIIFSTDLIHDFDISC